MSKKLVAITALTMAVSANSVAANSEQYDRSVAAAAAKIAAERLGTTRGSIDFNEQPDMVSHRDVEKKSPGERDQSLIWIPPEPESQPEPLQRVSQTRNDGVDTTMTGSTTGSRTQSTRPTFWEWFDGEGNPIDPPY